MKIKRRAFDKVFKSNDKKYTTLAVVGNSGKLRGSGHGEYIDSHDAVIRINAAPTKGYEEDVGSRTDYRVVNGLLQKGKTLNYTTTPAKWISKIENENLIYVPVSDRSENIADSLINSSCTVFRLTQTFKNYMNDVKKELGRFPSSGLFTCLLASCIAEEITLFGFGFHQESLSNRHYWEKWTDSHDSSHEWTKEEEILTRFCESDQFEIAK